MRVGAAFVTVKNTADALIIRDVGPWSSRPTVTNDAEGVIEFLLETEQIKPAQRLFYYDSEGQLDELLIHGGKFTGFAPSPQG